MDQNPEILTGVGTMAVAVATVALVIVTAWLVSATRASAKDAATAAKAAKDAAEAAAAQVQLADTTARGDFLIRLEQMLQQPQFAAISARLLRWGNLGNESARAQEFTDAIWTEIIPYMGLFERVNALLKLGLLDPVLVTSFYGYRVDNLVAQTSVRERLRLYPDDWANFIELWHTVDLTRKRKHSRHEIPCSSCAGSE
jgi:hypothetical protein